MDNLGVIRQVMDQHKVLLDRLKLVGDQLSDREALISIEKARTDLVSDVKATTAEKRNRLEETLAMVEAGMRNHYAFEERVLPPLLGELLTEALVFEHKQLMAELEQAKLVVHTARLEQMTRDELLNEETLMYSLISRIRREKEEHLRKEESMLLMLEKLLEAKARTVPATHS